MRTPTVMIIGMVLAPCGLVLNLTSTVAPDWRQLSQLNGYPQDVSFHQGLWDNCKEAAVGNTLVCGQEDVGYFNTTEVQVARGLMIASLAVTTLGIVVACLGVRCWQDVPMYWLAGLGGLLIFFSGILSLVPVSFYNNGMYNLPSKGTISVGYALVLGYLGSCLEIIGGFSLALSLVHSCKRCMENRGKPPASAKYYSKNTTSMQKKTPSYPISHYSPNDHHTHASPYPQDLGYSVGNDNYHHGNDHRYATSHPISFINPINVTEGEHTKPRPGSQLSSLPCDSDLL